MKNYKISLFDCKNKHIKDNILLSQFENTQYIDESKIICEICKTNKSLTFENNFFICITCKINICPLCKIKHDKKHDIIDYTQKNFICFCHNENYNSYCDVCKKDICLYCEKEHAGHKLISFGEIVPDKEDLKEKLNAFRNKINEFKKDIKDIMKNLNNLIENLDIYVDIYEKMIINFEKKYRNYPILQNFIDINQNNIIIMENINKIINNKNIKNKFNDMIDIYSQMINIESDQSKEDKIYLNQKNPYGQSRKPDKISHNFSKEEKDLSDKKIEPPMKKVDIGGGIFALKMAALQARMVYK